MSPVCGIFYLCFNATLSQSAWLLPLTTPHPSHPPLIGLTAIYYLEPHHFTQTQKGGFSSYLNPFQCYFYHSWFIPVSFTARITLMGNICLFIYFLHQVTTCLYLFVCLFLCEMETRRLTSTFNLSSWSLVRSRLLNLFYCRLRLAGPLLIFGPRVLGCTLWPLNIGPLSICGILSIIKYKETNVNQDQKCFLNELLTSLAWQQEVM